MKVAWWVHTDKLHGTRTVFDVNLVPVFLGDLNAQLAAAEFTIAELQAKIANTPFIANDYIAKKRESWDFRLKYTAMSDSDL